MKRIHHDHSTEENDIMNRAFRSVGMIAPLLGFLISADTPAVAQGLGGAARGAVVGIGSSH